MANMAKGRRLTPADCAADLQTVERPDTSADSAKADVPSPRLGRRPTNHPHDCAAERLAMANCGRTILPSAPALRAMRRGGGDGSRTTNRPNSMRPLACASAPRKAIW